MKNVYVRWHVYYIETQDKTCQFYDSFGSFGDYRFIKFINFKLGLFTLYNVSLIPMEYSPWGGPRSFYKLPLEVFFKCLTGFSGRARSAVRFGFELSMSEFIHGKDLRLAYHVVAELTSSWYTVHLYVVCGRVAVVQICKQSKWRLGQLEQNSFNHFVVVIGRRLSRTVICFDMCDTMLCETKHITRIARCYPKADFAQNWCESGAVCVLIFPSQHGPHPDKFWLRPKVDSV